MKNKIGMFIKRTKLLSDLWALLLLALGVFLLMRPNTAVKVVCQVIGIGMLLYGLVLIISFLAAGTRTSYGNPNIFRVIFGVLLLVMGLFVSVRPNTIEQFAGILFAVLLFAWSINQFLEMKNLVELKDPRWWMALLAGLVTVIFACVVMFAPIGSTELLMRVAGIGLVYTAVSGLFFNFRAVHYVRKYERTYGPLIEDVTGQNVSIGPPKDPPPVIDGEVRIVEDDNKQKSETGEKKKEKKKGLFGRRKKKEASESPADDGEKSENAADAGEDTDSAADAEDQQGSVPDAEAGPDGAADTAEQHESGPDAAEKPESPSAAGDSGDTAAEETAADETGELSV